MTKNWMSKKSSVLLLSASIGILLPAIPHAEFGITPGNEIPNNTNGKLISIIDNEDCALQINPQAASLKVLNSNQHAAKFDCANIGNDIIRRDNKLFVTFNNQECGLNFADKSGSPSETVRRHEYLANFSCDGNSADLIFEGNTISTYIRGRKCGFQVDGRKGIVDTLTNDQRLSMFDCRNDGDTMSFVATEAPVVEPPAIEPPVIEKPSGEGPTSLSGLWFDSAGRTTSDLRNPQYLLRLDRQSSINLELESSNIDTVVMLLDRSSETIYEGSVGGNSSQLNLTLDAGEYIVIAATRLQNQRGAFTLTSSTGDLQGSHVQFFNDETSGRESAYYQKLDPSNSKNTYAKWLSANGFSPRGTTPNANEIKATYFNDGDLRLGREMRCLEQSSGRAACTTVNYGSPGDIDSAESSLQAAIDQVNPLAAVTMEYDPSNTENPVSFWVFNMQSAEQERIEFLQLDNEHAKSVPGVCLNCHAGKFDSATNSVTGATFLPFDVETFIFQAKGDYSESALSENIRQLNDMVKRVNEGVGNTSIPTLIDGWYGDSSIEGAVVDKSFVPPSFASNRQDRILYKEVLQKSCLNCHAAIQTPLLDMVNSNGNAIKAFVQPFLCQTQEGLPIMPHAEASDISFWENSVGQKILIDDIESCRQTRFGDGYQIITP